VAVRSGSGPRHASRAGVRNQSLSRAGLAGLLLVAACGAGLLPAGPAAAHARLVGAQPADGSVVAAPLDHVRLIFDTAISPEIVTVVVAGPGGVRFRTGEVTVADRQVNVPLQPPARQPGRYRTAYRAIGADGHPVTGELRFHLTAPASGEAASTATVGLATPGGREAGDVPLRSHLLHILIGVVIVGVGGWVLLGMRNA
jgi:copper resistance protein C